MAFLHVPSLRKHCCAGPSANPFACAEIAIAAGLAWIMVPEEGRATEGPAATVIESVATATFDIGPVRSFIRSNHAVMRIEAGGEVILIPAVAGPIALDAETRPIAFALTNAGNASGMFRVVVLPGARDDGFAPMIDGLVADANGNGTYEVGEDRPLDAGGLTEVLPAGGNLTVFALAHAPPEAETDAPGRLLLSATLAKEGSAPSIAGSRNDLDGLLGRGSEHATAFIALRSAMPGVNLEKSGAMADGVDFALPVSGATIDFSITARVTGSGSIKALLVSDEVPGGTAFVPGSLRLDGQALTDAEDEDAGRADGREIHVAIASAAAGTARQIMYSVRIN